MKIAKSAGNGILLHNLAEAGYDPLDVRMLLLQSHYRSQANFTMGGLAAARQRRQSLQAFADLRFQAVEGGELDAMAFEETQRVIFEELNNDLHTPEALAALSDIASSAETRLVAPEGVAALTTFIAFLDRMFGLKLGEAGDITPEQKSLIEQRQVARQQKDFGRADELRNQLRNQRIELRDTPIGSVWWRSL